MKLPVTPKKSLGQNFLNSPRVLSRIVDEVDPIGTDIILEIGPGLGALTEKLLHFVAKVVAVEKDDTLYSMLHEKFAAAIEKKQLDLIHGDILEFDPELLRFYKDFDYSVVANIPYNITGLIFRKFLTADYQPNTMVVLIQKEVATRILARDGKESLLSLSVKAYGTPKLVTHVSRGNFTPAPNVDSSVLKIEDISRNKFKNSNIEELFFKLIHAGFAHKRKVLIKNLLDENIGTRHLWEEAFTKRKLVITTRSEDLTVDDWIFLAESVDGK